MKCCVLTEKQIDRLHGASLAILDLVGVIVPHEDMLSRLADRGARVDRAGQRVRMPEELIQWAIEKAGIGQPMDPIDVQQLREAEIKLVEARIRLAERKELLSQATGGDVLVRLNAELTTLSIDQAEKRARLAGLASQRQRMQRLRDDADHYAQSVAELEQLQKEENDIRSKMSVLATEYQEVQPLAIELVGEIKAK